MTQRVAVQARPSIAARFGAFVLERYPFAAHAAAAALDAVAGGELSGGAEALERARTKLGPALRRALPVPPADLPQKAYREPLSRSPCGRPGWARD